MPLLVHKETAVLNARVEALSEAMYLYKSVETEGAEKEARKKDVERQIASLLYSAQELSNQFSSASVHDYLEEMYKEEE